jgi:hypothetical protein
MEAEEVRTMNREQIIRMAQQAGAFTELSTTPEKDVAFLQRFAALAYAAGQRDMRERAEEAATDAVAFNGGGVQMEAHVRKTIRALPLKGEKT